MRRHPNKKCHPIEVVPLLVAAALLRLRAAAWTLGALSAAVLTSERHSCLLLLDPNHQLHPTRAPCLPM
jgi:hypothetical protein